MNEPQPIIYDSKPNPERHPDRLRVIAALKGIRAAPFQKCRVLDIGCGVGLDVIHHALHAPDSEFIGFDLSEEHLAIGRKLVQQLDLKNVKLETADIATFADKKKSFDYILCHGVFSWVPVPMQQDIFRICQTHLAPEGIAYISFNALPGWNARSAIRKLLRQTDRPADTAIDRVEHARCTMEHILERLKDSQTPYSQQLQTELESCVAQSAAFIFHELLADTNSAFYLGDFLKAAAPFGLQYLGDGRPSRMRVLPGELEDQNLREALQLSAQPAALEEQIWDLLLPAALRGCMLCSDSCIPSRQLELSHVWDMHISSTVVPLSDAPRLDDTSIEVFCDAREYNLEIDSPQIKSALTALSKHWPASLSVQALIDEATQLAGQNSTGQTGESKPLIASLGEFFLMNLVDLYFEPATISSVISETPTICPFTRAQAALGFSWVSNPRFEYVPIEELDRQIISLLNGENTVADCITQLLSRAENGEIRFKATVTDDTPRSTRETLEAQLPLSLSFYLESALLIA